MLTNTLNLFSVVSKAVNQFFGSFKSFVKGLNVLSFLFLYKQLKKINRKKNFETSSYLEENLLTHEM